MSEFIGKYLLVGITYLDKDEKVVEQYQTHGKILSVDEDAIVIEKTDGTGQYSLPPDTSSLQVATAGEYKLRCTGEIIVNPDLISTWTVYEGK